MRMDQTHSCQRKPRRFNMLGFLSPECFADESWPGCQRFGRVSQCGVDAIAGLFTVVTPAACPKITERTDIHPAIGGGDSRRPIRHVGGKRRRDGYEGDGAGTKRHWVNENHSRVCRCGYCGPGRRDDRIQTLYTYCKDETAEFTYGYCLSYLNGSWEYLNVLSAFPGAVRAAGICAPPASMMQLQRVFLNWAERNPQRWSENRAFGVQAAFSEAWPCK
jgi:hypothetical protein